MPPCSSTTDTVHYQWMARHSRRRGPRKVLLFDPLAFRGRIQLAMANRGMSYQKDITDIEDGADEGQLSRALSKGGLPGITVDVALRIAKGLDVSIGWLIAGDGDSGQRFVHEPGRRRVIAHAQPEKAPAVPPPRRPKRPNAE